MTIRFNSILSVWIQTHSKHKNVDKNSQIQILNGLVKVFKYYLQTNNSYLLVKPVNLANPVPAKPETDRDLEYLVWFKPLNGFTLRTSGFGYKKRIFCSRNPVPFSYNPYPFEA